MKSKIKSFLFRIILGILIIFPATGSAIDLSSTFSYLADTEITDETTSADKIKRCLFWAGMGATCYGCYRLVLKGLSYIPTPEFLKNKNIVNRINDHNSWDRFFVKALFNDYDFGNKLLYYSDEIKIEEIKKIKNIIKKFSNFISWLLIYTYTKNKINNRLYRFTYFKSAIFFTPLALKIFNKIKQKDKKQKGDKKINVDKENSWVSPAICGIAGGWLHDWYIKRYFNRYSTTKKCDFPFFSIGNIKNIPSIIIKEFIPELVIKPYSNIDIYRVTKNILEFKDHWNHASKVSI